MPTDSATYNGLSLVWFRQDLRTDDHPSLAAAARSSRTVIPVYVWSPQAHGHWSPGAASRWWIHESLKDLSRRLDELGSRLILRLGPPAETLLALAKETGASSVWMNGGVEPAAREEEARVRRVLEACGVRVEVAADAFLFDPESVRNLAGQPFRVFTHFWNKCLSLGAPASPEAPPSKLPSPKVWPRSETLDRLGLEPDRDWNARMKTVWRPESGLAALKDFTRGRIGDYARARDLPASDDGVSRISPYLAQGLLSARRVWREVDRLNGPRKDAAKETYLRQLGWREFARHLLWHFPHTPYRALHEEFDSFPWEKDRARLRAWRKGLTGYPIVDAGMRQLWSTGWMHNRVRMICGSFLVKDLLIHWREGASWFWETLIDADLANNTLGWQWVAGCGADAAPFFRIFNPVTQGEKFDPRGEYVRRWVPELSQVPDRFIHKPWEMPRDLVGRHDYPGPLVDHARAREKALAVFQNRGRVKAAHRSSTETGR